MVVRKGKPRPNARKHDREALSPIILEQLEQGKSLAEACAEVGITHSMFGQWRDDDPDLETRYARSRDIGLELMASEILPIADDESTDVNRARLRVDARKWLLSKRLPKAYGDRVGIDHSGGVSVSVVTGVPDR